ncbi:fat-like cadherin-related tumor suppressor homolog [Nilaparvata lugens]|uniref:fat-like cadherin-related tumor suppressor homolog n=1 Tax=Nilaparvata lugens TaxID=108931 RepID=UPI00193CC712|nr:fat-like cadherin-related tumor suppressor homolog [Nilaparvata lugens]
MKVTISDDGSPTLSSTTRVVVAVDDVNDHAPEFEQAFYKIVIPRTRHQDAPLFQNGSGDTELALEALLENGTWESFTQDELLGEALFRVHAVDRDIGNNAELHYSIKSGRGKGKFGIHPSTGTVYSQRSFAAGQEYDLLVKATDYGSPNKSSTARVSVTVKDTPEESPHAPVIRQPDQRVQVTESDTVGFLVALVQATDEDGDMLWYYIVGGDPRSEFVISGDKGSVLVAKQLDREVQSEYNLTISVTDGVHTVLTQLYVTVMDINEHRPWFTQNLYSANVSESTPVGTEVVQLQATDEDQDSKVLYSLHSARSPASLAAFKVDYQTGVITVVQSLDRESIAEHLLTVMVKDAGTPAKRNFARVVIHVYDANDHAPEFSSAIIQGRVFETADVGSAVVTVLAVDKDHGNNAVITYSITSGNVGNAFTIDPLMGTIRVAKELDMNSIAEYMLIVKAVDGGATPLSSTLPVHIMVVMADNAAPRFLKREVAAELYENEPAGAVVKHLEARSTSSLLFELIRGDSEGHFAVDPSTGVVTTQQPLDYETNRVFNLSVTATSMAGAKAVCHVIVHVLDRNDNAPRFVQAAYEGKVAEDSPVGTLVLTNGSVPLVIKASDADSELNSLLQYDIVEAGPRRMFHIDSSTGAIRTMQMLDYETMPEVVFHVRVSDLGKPRLSSETAAKVRINILDTNDCVPAFTQKEYKASVLMPTFTNVAVIQLEAKDGDSADLTKLSYEILTGNSENIYAMNSSTGVITVRDTVRGARTSPHRLKVSVSDGRFSSEAHVNIQWEQSQHSGLMFQRKLYQGSVLENSTKVSTVSVVNVVGSQLNEHLVFTILNPSPLFQIGRTSGAVRTTGLRFDRELQEHYQLIVQARSEEYGRDSPQVAHVRVNVTVLDINDNCPMFVNLPYYAVVSVDAHKEMSSLRYSIYYILLDLDKGENGEVRYELIRGHGELFRVDRKSGEISLKQGLEGHNKDYQLIIAAYDGGMSPCSTEVQVNVKVMDRSMPVFDKQFYTVSTPEDIEVHTPLAASIRAESPLDRKLIYSIVNGNHFEEFAVDFNTASDDSNGPCEYCGSLCVHPFAP